MFQRQFKRFYSKKITIYQYEACPFSHKVKAFLKYQKLDFNKVEVNPMSKAEISFSKDYKKVPIAIIDGEQVNNSFDIIKKLSQEPITSEVEKWNEFVDKRLAVTLLPNLYKSYSQALEAFEYISNVPGWSNFDKLWLKYGGAFFMRALKIKLMKKYGLKLPDPRTTLYELMDEFQKEFESKEYLSGNQITLSDVIVFGVFKTVAHLQTGREIFNHYPKIHHWYQKIEKQIE